MVIALFGAVVVPLVLGVALMAGDRLATPLRHVTAWVLALVASAATLVLVLVGAVTHAVVDRPWVPQLGMRARLEIDGISGPLVVLAAAVTLLAVAISMRQRPTGTPGLFYGSLLVVLGGAVAAFTLQDVIAFFVAFEVVLVPMWVLIDRYGDQASDRRRAGWLFVLYTVTGSMFMLLGLLVLSTSAGTTDISTLAGGAAASLPFATKMTAAVLLTVGLAVKVPLFGVHTWLPRAHTSAPTAASVVLAAILLKLGTYGFVRFVVLPLPDAWRQIAPVVAILAVLGIIVAGLVCLVERDLKRLVAWSSIAHMGFVMLALAAGQEIGLQAALYGNLAHGAVAALLFAVVGALRTRRGHVGVEDEVLGLRRTDPRLGFALLVGLAASLGLPGLATFWGEALAIFAAWDAEHRPHLLFHVLALVAAFGSVLAAAYCLRVARFWWSGTRSSGRGTPAAPQSDDAAVDDPDEQVRGVELVAIVVLTVAVIALGLVPSLLMHLPADELARALGGLS